MGRQMSEGAASRSQPASTAYSSIRLRKNETLISGPKEQFPASYRYASALLALVAALGAVLGPVHDVQVREPIGSIIYRVILVLVVLMGVAFAIKGIRDVSLISTPKRLAWKIWRINMDVVTLRKVREILIWEASRVLSLEHPVSGKGVCFLCLYRPYGELSSWVQKQIVNSPRQVALQAGVISVGGLAESAPIVLERIVKTINEARGDSVPVRLLTRYEPEEFTPDLWVELASHELPAEIRINPGVFCIECGFDLRSLQTNQRCPECGTSIARSLHGRLLAYADPRWLGKVALGSATLAMAIPIFLTSFVLNLVRVFLPKLWPFVALGMGNSFKWVAYTLIGVGCGTALFAAREPRIDVTHKGSRLRLGCQISLLFAIASVVGMKWISAPYPNFMAFLALILSSLSLLAFASSYAGQLFGRIPLRGWPQISLWTSISCYGLAAPVGLMLVVLVVEPLYPGTLSNPAKPTPASPFLSDETRNHVIVLAVGAMQAGAYLAIFYRLSFAIRRILRTGPANTNVALNSSEHSDVDHDARN
jgi:predicted RNA-binding Zn-ribbon protein involved in translation (DUF1610 family)